MPKTAASRKPELAQVASPPAHTVVAGRFDERAGYHVQRRTGARTWLLTVTSSGAGRFRHAEAAVTAGPGEVVLLGPAVEQEYGAVGHWEFWWAHFTLRPSWQARLAPYRVGPRLYFIGGLAPPLQRRLERTFGGLLADARWAGSQAPAPVPAGAALTPVSAAGGPGRDLALIGIETVLLLALAGARGAESEPGLDPRVRQARDRMLADPGAAHTVTSLAAAAALSPSRFAHLFAQQTGQTPMRMLAQARLEHAARLLSATDLDVGRIARACGFASPFHFSRAFRARFGRPPTTYRTGPAS